MPPPKINRVIPTTQDRKALSDAVARTRTQDLNFVNTAFIGDIRLNTKRGRRILASYVSYVRDLGGEQELTFGQKELIRRAAALAMICADLEEKLVNSDEDFGEQDFNRYLLATKTLASIQRVMGVGLYGSGNKPAKVFDYIEGTTN